MTIFQMQAGAGMPAIPLSSQAGIIARLAGELEQLLLANTDAVVSMDVELPPALATVFHESLFGPVPDPKDFQ